MSTASRIWTRPVLGAATIVFGLTAGGAPAGAQPATAPPALSGPARAAPAPLAPPAPRVPPAPSAPGPAEALAGPARVEAPSALAGSVRVEPPVPAPVESPAPPELPSPSKASPGARAGAAAPGSTQAKATAHWYERLRLRGYTQLRYNRLFASNDEYVNVQGDRSIGKLNGFSLRRARLIVSGDVHERVAVYLQTDAASAVGDLTHVVAMRDWYADLFLDAGKEARVRVGQSKVPFGFENMQSSQNRVPLDRSDAINTGAPNERDLGVFFYWAPAEVRARFKHLIEAGLKGSGDFGVVALGAYNGQGTNLKEKNDNLHLVARATYPFLIGDQIVEVGGGGYTGKYVVTKGEETGGPEEFRDARGHVTFVLYPQPFGLQAEYGVGVGPELDASRGVVREGRPHGGYAMAMLRVGPLLPYVRASFYDGGKKHEADAPKYKVREAEAGVEWRAHEALELTAAFVQGTRTAPKAPFQSESGRLVRLQLQFNY